MSQKTIQYNLLSLYCSDIPASGVNITAGQIKQFNGIQGANLTITYPSIDIKSLGNLNTEDAPNSSPLASIQVEALLGDGRNEALIGLNTDGDYGSFFPMFSGQKNYYMAVDSFAGLNGDMVVGLGNGSITSYGIQASVGDVIKTSFSIEGFNLNLSHGQEGNPRPDVNTKTGKEISGVYSMPNYFDGVIQKSPGQLPSRLFTTAKDISLRIVSGSILGMPADIPLSSFSLSVPIDRQVNSRMGEKYPYSRPVECPISATLSLTAIVTGLVSGRALDFSNFNRQSFEIVTKKSCGFISKTWREDEYGDDILNIKINGARLTNQSLPNGIGSSSVVSADFSILISNLVDYSKNILFSGSFGRLDTQLSDYTIQKSGITASGSYQLLTPEPVFSQTGYFVEEYSLIREYSVPNFSLDFSGNYYIRSGDIPPYFTGYLPAIQQKSGNMNSGSISVGTDIWTVSTSLPNPDLSKTQNSIEYFYGFTAPATTGYLTTGSLPNLFPEEQTVTEFKFYSPVSYDFSVKSENLFSGWVGITYQSDYPISISFATGNFVTPARPISINQLTAYFPNRNQDDIGRNFDVYFVLNSGNITKTYRTNWTVT